MSTESNLVTVTNVAARLQILAFERHTTGPSKGELAEPIRLAPFQTVDLTAEQFASLKKTPAWQAGEFEEGVQRMPKGRCPDITKATEADAIRFVNDSTDLAHLTAWQQNESRGPVILAIAARRKALA